MAIVQKLQPGVSDAGEKSRNEAPSLSEQLGATQIHLYDVLSSLSPNNKIAGDSFPDGGQGLLNAVRNKLKFAAHENQLRVQEYVSENFTICKNITEGFTLPKYGEQEGDGIDNIEQKIYERYIYFIQHIPVLQNDLTFAYKANCYIYQKIQEEKKNKAQDSGAPGNTKKQPVDIEPKKAGKDSVLSIPFGEIKPTYDTLKDAFNKIFATGYVDKYERYMSTRDISKDKYMNDVYTELENSKKNKDGIMSIHSSDDDPDTITSAIQYIRYYLQHRTTITPEMHSGDLGVANNFLKEMIGWVISKFSYLTPTELIRITTACYRYYHNARVMSYIKQRYTTQEYKKLFLDEYFQEQGKEYEEFVYIYFESDAIVLEISDASVFDRIYNASKENQQDTKNTAGSHTMRANGLHIILLDLTKCDPNHNIRVHEYQHKENHIYFPSLISEGETILDILLKKGIDEVIAAMHGGLTGNQTIQHMHSDAYKYLNYEKYGWIFSQESPELGDIHFCDRGYYAWNVREQYEHKIEECIRVACDLRNAFVYYNGGDEPEQFYTFLIQHPPMKWGGLIDEYLLAPFGVARELCDAINKKLNEGYLYSFFCFLKQYEPLFFEYFVEAFETGNTEHLLSLEDLDDSEHPFEGRTNLSKHDYARILSHKEYALMDRLGIRDLQFF